MKSLVLHGIGDLRIEEVPYPELRPGWVILKIRVIQPSITEVLLSRGIPSSDYVEQAVRQKGPSGLFGHELCGDVVKVSRGAQRLKEGDRVTSMGGTSSCGECEFCKRGKGQLCRNRIGWGSLPGSRFAEYAAMPERMLVRVPDTISDNEAATMQPFASCVAAVNSANIKMEDKVAVLGQGCMGLSTMQIARVTGAKQVITTDVREESLKMSRFLGADLTVNASTEDPVKHVLDFTDNEGVDIVFETSGGPPQLGLSGYSGLAQAARMTKRGGKVVQIAILPSLTVDLSGFGEKSLIFPQGEDIEEMEHGISLVSSGRVKLKPLITHVLKGIEKVPEAFEITGNKSKYRAVNPAQVEI